MHRRLVLKFQGVRNEVRCTFMSEYFDIYMFRSASSLVFDGGTLGLWCKVDGYQGSVTATVSVSVEPRPREMLQTSSAPEDDKCSF